MATTTTPPDLHLEETTDNLTPPPPSPRATEKYPMKPLRRRKTVRNINQNLDSSESWPSHHSSLYDAPLQSFIQENEPSFAPQPPSDNKESPPRALWESMVTDSDGNAVPASFLIPPDPRRMHTPHALYPITEKSSFATLRPPSMHNKNSSATLRSRSSGLIGKKLKSFSLSDLPPSPTPEEQERRDSPSPPLLLSVLPTPNQPRYPPPARTPTPPGLPTFGEPEAINYRLPPPAPCTYTPNSDPDAPLPPNPIPQTRTKFPTLKQRFLGPGLTPEMRQWRAQTVGLPHGVVMRGEGGLLLRGKFVPIRSAHFPPLGRKYPTLSGGLGCGAVAGGDGEVGQRPGNDGEALAPGVGGEAGGTRVEEPVGGDRKTRNGGRRWWVGVWEWCWEFCRGEGVEEGAGEAVRVREVGRGV